jgi:outer membrane protein TolC
MTRRLKFIWAVLTSAMIALTGCHPSQPFYLFDDKDLSHYVDKAISVDYPDSQTTQLAEIENAQAPLTLNNPEPKEIWELKLEDAIKLALANSKVYRTLNGAFGSNGIINPAPPQGPQNIGGTSGATNLISNPDTNKTVYDAAITDTTPGTGVEAALAAFDTQWTSSIQAQHNLHPQNVSPTSIVSGFVVPVFKEDNTTFNNALTKITATGGQFAMTNYIFYDNVNTKTVDTPYTSSTNVQLTFNQPLLAGGGVQYNRIAGPFNPFAGIISSAGSTVGTTTFDGVLLARIATDISLADLEANVRNTLSDTENAYWELYFTYRYLEAQKTARSSTLQTWRKIHALYLAGARGGEAEKEAQARAQYFQYRANVQLALNSLFVAENSLRYMLGLSVSDGRLIRPADEPPTAKVSFEWRDIHAEGLARSVELRRQKWRIKQRELELIAARNQIMPRLDVNGIYRFVGLGQDLYNTNPASINGPGYLQGTSALGVLGSGQFQEWQLGANFAMPLGFRKELAQVRFYELNLAREKARLQDYELEVSNTVASALRSVEYSYALAQTTFNRRVAAEKQVEAVQAAFDAETVTLDLLLTAQQARADAELSYFRLLTDYAKSITNIHFRKGSLLEYDGVYLTEGPWPAKAKFDAYRLARQRDASFFLDYGFTRPRVISQGPYRQFAEGKEPATDEQRPLTTPAENVPSGATPETVPTPPPTPRVQPPGDVESGDRSAQYEPAGAEARSEGGSTSTALAGSRDPQKSNSGKRRTTARPVAKRDEDVEPASYSSKTKARNELVEDLPPDPTDRPAANWQGTQRE